jgi:peptide/nickel transport system ATP-binding protein
MIAMAIACKPQLLIADEPTTALDVTVQNYPVVERHSARNGMSIIFISHDLSLVSAIAIGLVMYQGEIVEQGVKQILKIRNIII